MIEIILESFNSLFKSFDIFLKTKDLTLGAILAGLAPFIVIWSKLSREREKKIRSQLIERRQMQIAFNVNEIMQALKVESKWSLQEIGSTHTVQKNSKPWLTIFMKVIQKMKSLYQRRMIMERLKSRKFWMAILAVIIPVINSEFGINLDTPTIIGILSAILGYIAVQGHVDAKAVQNGGSTDAKPTGDTGNAV